MEKVLVLQRLVVWQLGLTGVAGALLTDLDGHPVLSVNYHYTPKVVTIQPCAITCMNDLVAFPCRSP